MGQWSRRHAGQTGSLVTARVGLPQATAWAGFLYRIAEWWLCMDTEVGYASRMEEVMKMKTKS